jgi:CheY-specific phosphatase CheX
MENNEILKQVLSAIVYRSELFFKNEMEIETFFDGAYRSVEKIELKKYTTMIGIGGSLNLLFYTTYDDELLDNLTKKLAYGEIGEGEFTQLRESASGEIANMIVGHSIGDFPSRGEGVSITPPVTIEDAKSIIKTNDTRMVTATLSTPYGKMEFNVIGSLKGDAHA